MDAPAVDQPGAQCRLQLSPADAAHSGRAYLKGIDWRFLPDSVSRYAALQAGTVDVVDTVQPDTLAAAKKSRDLVAIDAPRPGASNRNELNSSIAPFGDAKVREAFIRSANVNDAVSSLFFGTAKRSYSALSSAEKSGISEPCLFDYDQEAAAKLLDEAGWSTKNAEGYRTRNGAVLELSFPVSTNQSIPAEQSLFEQLQATSKQAGFKVDLKPLDLSSWYGALGGNQYNLVSAAYTKVEPDVLRILLDSAGTKPAPSGYFANHSQVKDPALDALLEKAATSSDAAERQSLYKQSQEIVLEGFYVLRLYDQQNRYLNHSVVKGMRAMPTVSTPTMYDTWLSRLACYRGPEPGEARRPGHCCVSGVWPSCSGLWRRSPCSRSDSSPGIPQRPSSAAPAPRRARRPSPRRIPTTVSTSL